MKILLVDYYSKDDNESLSQKLISLGCMVDKIFKTDLEEVRGLLAYGKYNYLFIGIGFLQMRKTTLNMVNDIRKDFQKLPIVGLLSSEKDNLKKDLGFTEMLTSPISFEKVKNILAA